MPAQDHRQHMPCHRIARVHRGGERGGQDLTPRLRVVAGQHMHRIMRQRKRRIQPAMRARERIIVGAKMRPQCVAETFRRQLAQRREPRRQHWIGAIALIGQQPRVHIAAGPGCAGDAFHVAAGHVRQRLLQAPACGVGDLVEIACVDPKRRRIAQHRRDLGCIEHAVDKRHDGQEAHGVVRQVRARKRRAQPLRRDRGQCVGIERLL